MSTPGTPPSRFTILNWINDTLLLPLTRIEQLGSGSVYCQLLDAAYPERVPLHRVKWDARLEVDFLHNFKILQNCFEYLGIEKKIDIGKLAKARYQDNLEFVQWVMAYVEGRIDYGKYQPLKRRNYAKLYLGFVDKKKFNVTLTTTSTTNKQNLDCSTHMKSSIKSTSTIKSMVSSRSSMSILSCHQTANTSKNTTIQKPQKKQTTAVKTTARRSVGPAISLVGGHKAVQLGKQQSSGNIVVGKGLIRNVEAIQSEEEDQFF